MSGELRWHVGPVPRPQLQLVDAVVPPVGGGRYAGLEFLEVHAKRVSNTMHRPGRLPFRHTINAYRGCSHACTYCFARPTHEYLGLDLGRDFETKIVVKVNAVESVRRETAPARWSGELIAMGTNTDPYQPAEGRYRLTRGIVDVLGERRNPFSILTKSSLVLRDLDVLSEAAARTDVTVDFSVGTLDEAVWQATEPGTPHPRQRLAAVARLNDAGVPSGVLLGPILPGLSDHPDQIEEVVRVALAAGATSLSAVLLHLRPGVKGHYLDFLERQRPDLVDLHHRRYGKRAFPPGEEQRRLSRLVAAMVATHGGVRRSARPARPTAPPTPPAGPNPEQLGLGI